MPTDFIYLKKQDILIAHHSGMNQFGGMAGPADESCIEKRINEPQEIIFGIETYPTLSKKAAAYLYKLIISHCFTDGNKRAAILSTELFLNFNGYEFSASEDKLYDLCLTIGNHQTRPDLPDIATWIESNIRKLDDEW